VIVAFRAKPVEEICGDCELWVDKFDFDHYGDCKIHRYLTHYSHRCDAKESKR